jgi:SIT family siderophore-iron:H+ symporter-like MFS transporter
MSRAHGETQRVLSITGTVLAAVGLLVACGLEWVKLTDDVTLDKVEKAEDGKVSEAVK